ncbi:hypothetical protein A3D88_00960 [Candidatus Peribacteria bacterium RIFCSPHIGHO2_02_FULL_52_16]|nr:MAG: hypothetical protein A2706_05605 [Candidatus Peribacteria bacterium RIFCSPHIGHO2_01_FULL_51_35]OGJ61236.1 MAG: hypothetical protein A3D88_00960 [Candidatus Peribacteria bacterium RIFCSPHIGHO2_02_FULL_52_16]
MYAKNRFPKTFDRYKDFVDLKALHTFSNKALRKSLRVNVLKSSVLEVLEMAKKRGWKLSPVPWCSEGFFVDGVEESELGRDLLHRTGAYYLQEAASMLPVTLMDPKPGEAVLDMCAAPGSKTTQIASALQGKGVIIANDPQERRLWVLKGALHRMGVTNVIVTKRSGTAFGKMIEQFDRVLCDAPCTAQGTSRKDSDALLRSHEDGTQKMAGIQAQLLESAVHAAKIGGRIVYSTCTLTPEENELQMLKILNTFSDQLEVVDPRTLVPGVLNTAVEDSLLVQKHLGIKDPKPFARLWPHRYDTEGFFAAVLQKKSSMRTPTEIEKIPFEEMPLSASKRKMIAEEIEEDFGTSFLDEDDLLFQKKELLFLLPKNAANLLLPFPNYALGLPYGKEKENRTRLSHEIISLRGLRAKKKIVHVKQADIETFKRGQTIDCSMELAGDAILLFDGYPLGMGMAKEGKIRHRFPANFLL